MTEPSQAREPALSATVPGATAPARLDIVSFNDVEAYRDTIRYSSSHMIVRRAPGFTGWLGMLELDGVGLVRSEHNASMSVTAAVRRPVFLFSTNPRSRVRVAGRDFPWGMLYRVDPGEPFHCSSEDYFAWATIGFDGNRLTADMETLGYRNLARLGHGALFNAAATPGWERLLATHRAALRTCMTTPAELASACAAAHLADTLTQALLECLDTGDLEPDRAAVRRHHAILNRMLDAIEADPRSEVTVTSLCRGANVTARTLQDVCLHYLGVTPTHYLRFHRLLRVHRALRASDPAVTGTREVFARNGFWDIARAEKAYRAVFGQMAGDTRDAGESRVLVQEDKELLTRFRMLPRGR